MNATLNNTVIIKSIGTANPSASVLLAEAFKIPQEIVLKLLYNTPSVLFHKVDEQLAVKAKTTLNKLGLIVKVQDSKVSLPTNNNLYEASVYIDNPIKLPKVVKQLSEFLGCEQKEALNILMQEPSIVIGGVSKATLKALSKRLDAKVTITNPKKDLYAIYFPIKQSSIIDDLKHVFKNSFSIKKAGLEYVIENLDFKTSQEIWRKYKSKKNIKIVNQSYQRFEIILTKIDKNDRFQREFLVKQIGIPKQILDKVLENLPIQLHESLSKKETEKTLKKYANVGLTCHSEVIIPKKHDLVITKITDLKKTRSILTNFFNENEIPTNKNKWISNKPQHHLLMRYAVAQLKTIGTNAKLKEDASNNEN